MTKTVNDGGMTASLVTARKRRHCRIRDRACLGEVKPGDQYVRAVMFPNHDAYGYTHGHPVVSTYCLPCASNYTPTDQLTEETP